MKRREQRRKREREQLPPALTALIGLIPAGTDSRKYLQETYSSDTTESKSQGDATIEGEGLLRLLEALGESCPEGAFDLLRVTRRVPRNQSTPERFTIAELCFAIGQATGPVNVHDRRRAAGSATGALDATSPLIQYYKGERFSRIVGGEGARSSSAHGAITIDGTEEDAEWRTFVASLETPLPMTLRVHSNERVLERVAKKILHEDPDVCTTVKPVKFMPPVAGLYSCSNRDYHSNKKVEFICRTLHAASAVSFQEVVSAIPVLVLDVQPHHRVLELCAAPGSKTLQALDGMLARGWTPAVARGVMITNEKDRVKATQTLPARLKRFHAPNVMCTRCDGTQWPRLYRCLSKDDTPVEQRFNRIICDVPCSGDGTVRKERSVATTWASGYVKSLVPTQTALLRRGLDMLEDDGILVYSTCSINPKEDEEVVCASLEVFGDSVELIDVNVILKAKGSQLHSSGGVLYPNVENLQKRELPPSYDGTKVLRVLPHRDDTGGFFIAAFRKRKQKLDWTPPVVLPHKLNQWTKGKLWSPVSVDDPHWTAIASFYGFDRRSKRSFVYYDSNTAAELAATSEGGLVPVYHLNPNGGPSKRIVLVTPVLAATLFHTCPYKGPGVEVVSVGVRAFEAYDGKFLTHAECRWRAVVEAASFLAPLFSRRKLVFGADLHREMLLDLLRNGFVHVRDYWWPILGDAQVTAECSAFCVEDIPYAKPGPLTDVLRLARTPGCDHAALATSVTNQLATEVEVGGVLLGIRRVVKDETEKPWYVSATLSGNKLELAIDASLRGFGLLAYFDIHDMDSHMQAGATTAEKQ